MPEAEAPRSESAGRPATWVEQIEKVSKHILLVSILVYAIGYVVAAAHYTSAGVPSSELSHNSFVGAGLLFVGITTLGVLASRFLLLIWKRIGNRRYLEKLSVAVLVFLVFSLPIGEVVRRAGPRGLLSWYDAYFLLTAVGGWFLPYLARRLSYLGWTFAFAVILIAIDVFSLAIYPYIPEAFGGGRPTRLFVWNVGEPKPPFPSPVVDLACPAEKDRPANCRIVSLVYTGPSHLYFSIEERTGRCDAARESIETSWPHVPNWPVDKSRFCFVRVLDSEVRELPIPSV